MVEVFEFGADKLGRDYVDDIVRKCFQIFFDIFGDDVVKSSFFFLESLFGLTFLVVIENVDLLIKANIDLTVFVFKKVFIFLLVGDIRVTKFEILLLLVVDEVLQVFIEIFLD